MRCNKLLQRVSKLKLLAKLRHDSAGGKADNRHNTHCSDDVGSGVTRVRQSLLVCLGLICRLVGRLVVGRLVVGRLGRGLVLLPLGVECYRGCELNLGASLVARAGAVRGRVPACEGIALARRLIGRDLSLGNVLDGSEIGGLLILGTVQVVGEIVGALLGRALLVVTVVAGLGYLAGPVPVPASTGAQLV